MLWNRINSDTARLIYNIWYHHLRCNIHSHRTSPSELYIFFLLFQWQDWQEWQWFVKSHETDLIAANYDTTNTSSSSQMLSVYAPKSRPWIHSYVPLFKIWHWIFIQGVLCALWSPHISFIKLLQLMYSNHAFENSHREDMSLLCRVGNYSNFNPWNLVWFLSKPSDVSKSKTADQFMTTQVKKQ